MQTIFTSAGRFFALIVLIAVTGCATPLPVGAPEFPQRAAPRDGQFEIELLAGLNAVLAIEDGCLGVKAKHGDSESFSTIIWPSNARLERVGRSWQVRNIDSDETIRVGTAIRGGGGYTGDFDTKELQRYNRMLVRDLGEKCAAKGAFTLNRDFRAG